MRRLRLALAAALLAPPLDAASQVHPHEAAPGDSTQALVGEMAGRMRGMQEMREMIHAIHRMMMDMHGQAGASGQGMPATEGRGPLGMCGEPMSGMGGVPQGRGMGMGAMDGQGQGMGGAPSGACLFASPGPRLSALLGGPVGALALTDGQWTELVRVLESAEREALDKLTPEQRDSLAAARAGARPCAPPDPPMR